MYRNQTETDMRQTSRSPLGGEECASRDMPPLPTVLDVPRNRGAAMQSCFEAMRDPAANARVPVISRPDGAFARQHPKGRTLVKEVTR